MDTKACNFLESINVANYVLWKCFNDSTGKEEDYMLSDLLNDYAINYDKTHKKVITADLEIRKIKFISGVKSYNLYNEDMLDAFIDYWTEHNEGGRKMRWETQKIFNISRRLGTWAKNDKNFKKSSSDGIKNRYNVGSQSYHAKLSDIGPGLLSK